MSNSKPIQIEEFSINQLLNFIKDNHVAIPAFQRGFVWSKNDIISLFDSLNKNYPIGSFVIWKTNERMEEPRYLFTNKSKKGKEKYLVIDGQQRLISIYYLCKEGAFNNKEDEFNQINENRSSIDFHNFRAIDPKRRQQNKGHALKFYNNHPRDVPIDDENDNENEKIKGLIDEDYRFPVIIVNLSSDKAVDAFKKINDTGTPVSVDAIFLANVWNKIPLGKILRAWKTKEKDSCGKIKNIIFIHAFELIYQLENKDEWPEPDMSGRRLNDIATKMKEDTKKTISNEKMFKKVLTAIKKAMIFLKNNLKIDKVEELPYPTMLSMLAIFFYYQDPPNDFQRNEILKWFWRSSLNNRYSGSNYNESTKNDPRMFYELAVSGKRLSVNPIKPEDLKKELEKTDIQGGGRSGLSKAVKLMLWQKEPTSIDGSCIDKNTQYNSEKKENDHFYPKKLIKEKRIRSDYNINSILNLCYLKDSENNNTKKEKLPFEWLANELEKVDPKNKEQILKKFFDTHALPYGSLKEFESRNKPDRDGVRYNRAYQKFKKARCKLFVKILMDLQKKGKIKQK